jgi:hypothetical protein
MIDTGEAAPDFELPDQDGTPVRLSELRGRRVVLRCARWHGARSLNRRSRHGDARCSHSSTIWTTRAASAMAASASLCDGGSTQS